MKLLIIIILAAIIVFIVVFNLVLMLPQFGKLPDYKNDNKILSSKQYSKRQFHNSGKVEMKMDFRKFTQMLKGFLKSNKNKKPPTDITISHKTNIPFNRPDSSICQICWFGHSSIMVDIDGKRILFDPVFSENASPLPFGVKRFENSLHLDDTEIKSLGKIDAIIISHDHYDHLDYNLIKNIEKQTEHFYVPLGVGAHLQHWGISKNRITELDWWEEINYENLKFVCTPAQHFSGRNPKYRNSSLWCSWAIIGNTKKVFFSGDSGYFGGFKEIGNKYGPFDISMIECGQYNELWKEIHMMPEQSVQAAIDLNSTKMLPIHNMSFSLALHSWDEPKKRVSEASKNKDFELIDIIPGDSFIIE
ncbi:MAG: MBL fold metallo-hydrolase [Bacteroidales bacterium]|nr:MBL fold metallo-hydrolase [Bacteroidales bacterium]